MGRFSTAFALIVGVIACADESDPPTGPSEAPPTTWVGRTLDGYTVIVVADGSTGFVGDVPTAVDVILGTIDCASLRGALEFWSSRVDHSSTGKRASAYAAVAQDRLGELGCPATSSG